MKIANCKMGGSRRPEAILHFDFCIFHFALVSLWSVIGAASFTVPAPDGAANFGLTTF